MDQNDFNCLSKSKWLELDVDYNDLDHPTCKADHPYLQDKIFQEWFPIYLMKNHGEFKMIKNIARFGGFIITLNGRN